MSPKNKNKNSLCEKKRKKGESTDIDTSSEFSEVKGSAEKETRHRDSTPHKRNKTSVSRDRLQTTLTFQKTSNMNETVLEKLDKLQTASDNLKEMIENSRTSLTNKIEEKTETLTALIFELQQENDILKKTLQKTQQQSEALKDEVRKLKDIVSEQKEELNDMEQYSRRESMRIHGINGDVRGETNEECEKKVLDIFRSKLGVNCDAEKISALHRVGKPVSGKHRPVLVKFISRKDKAVIIKERRKLKGSGVVITDDLTKLNVQRLNRLRQHEGVLSAWSAAGGKLFAKLLDMSVRQIVRGDTTIIDRDLIGSPAEERLQRRQQHQPQRPREQSFKPYGRSTPVSKQPAADDTIAHAQALEKQK